MHIAVVVGARPNFVKASPIVRQLDRRGARVTLIHTGQHYDAKLSDVFFEELDLRRPDVWLGIGSDLPGKQIGRIITAIEEVLLAQPSGAAFDWLVAIGDVNSTAGAAIAAVKADTPVCHVEAGLRSGDKSMPEEWNRMITDAVSSLHFATEQAAVDNLLREGHPPQSIHLVGNVMIDTLREHLGRASDCQAWSTFGLSPGKYGVVTLHRPSNVDDPDHLARLMASLRRISSQVPLVFPLHPRTRSKLRAEERQPDGAASLILTEPLGYLDFLSLTSKCAFVITDSGGLQDESTALGVPCLTMRENTERPVTVQMGSSRLLGMDCDMLEATVAKVLAGNYPSGNVPPMWDGQAAGRIADLLLATPR